MSNGQFSSIILLLGLQIKDSNESNKTINRIATWHDSALTHTTESYRHTINLQTQNKSPSKSLSQTYKKQKIKSTKNDAL